MKKIIFLLIYITVAAFHFSSCAKMKINFYNKKVGNIHKITLFSTMIGEIKQPMFPLIDATIFNTKTNSINDQIMHMHSANIDKCQVIVAASLKRNFNCKVIYADSLHSLEGFKEIKNKFDFKNSLKYESVLYPNIVTAKNDINPFPYEKGNVLNYFNNSTNYKHVISFLSEKVKTDLIAISYSNLTVTQAGVFGSHGYLRLDTYLYLFYKDGDKLVDAHTWSKHDYITGKKIEEYQSQLDSLSSIIEPVINTISRKYQNSSL